MTENYNELFKYNEGATELPEGAFKISPSSVEKFFSKKREWYGENLLHEDKKFTGSSATVLGTVCHAVAEVAANSKSSGILHDSDALHEAIELYIDSHSNNEEYDTPMIHSNWKNMASLLVNDFVMPANTVVTEKYIKHELIPGIWISGTMDAITSSFPTDKLDGTVEDLKNAKGHLTVRDYKTASTMPTTFSYPYKLQAMCYSYILTKMGIPITEMELCFVVKPTKTLPVRTKSFKLPYDSNSHNFIEGILMLIAESVQCFKDYEDLQYLLAGDYRLKVKDIPRP